MSLSERQAALLEAQFSAAAAAPAPVLSSVALPAHSCPPDVVGEHGGRPGVTQGDWPLTLELVRRNGGGSLSI